AISHFLIDRLIDDHTVLGIKTVSRRIPLLSGHLDQYSAGGSCGFSQLGPHLRGRPAPEGARIIGHQVGVSHDHGDGGDRQLQFFGDDLGQRGPYILAKLDFTRKNADLSIFSDLYPCTHFACRKCGRLVRGAAGKYQEIFEDEGDNQSAPGQLKEFTTAYCKSGIVHRWLFMIYDFEANLMAVTING